MAPVLNYFSGLIGSSVLDLVSVPLRNKIEILKLTPTEILQKYPQLQVQ